MKRSLSRIAALSLALGLATSTAHFASADILVLGVSPLPQNPALNTHRELIAEKYGNHHLPDPTPETIRHMKQACLNILDICYKGRESSFSKRPDLSEEDKKEFLEKAAKTFEVLYNIICGNAMRSTPHRIYIVRDDKTKTVNLYMQTESHPVAEYIGQLITEEGEIKIKLQNNAWVKLPDWKAPFVVIGPRQDAADFMSAIGALDKFPLGACYLDGSRAGLLAERALSLFIPGKDFQDARSTDPGIFIFFPAPYSLLGAIINADPYMKNNALMEIVKDPIAIVKEPMKIVKEKINQNLHALGKELFAEKNFETFHKAPWITPDEALQERITKAFTDYLDVRKQVNVSDDFRDNTDAVFDGNGPFYTLMRALWECAKTPDVEPDYTPDEEVRSFMEQIGAEKATEPTGESYGIEDVEVIKIRIQHLAEEYGLTEKVQEAAARFVQALQEKRMLDSSYNTGVNAYYAHLLSYLLEYASTCGIFANVSLDPKQLLLGAIVSNLKEQKWGGEITTEKKEKEKREKKVNHEVLKKRAQKKYNKR